jgi:hypothetical protein
MLRVSQPRIISFVRLLGKLGIFRPLLEYCALRWIDLRWRRCRPQKRGCRSDVGYRDKNAVMEIGTGIPGQDSLRHQVPDTAGSFQLPRAVLQRVFFLFYGRHRVISSVVAVSRADRSLVVFREGIS